MTSFSIGIENGIAEVRLTRPLSSNALDGGFWRNFAPSLLELDEQGTVRVAVITGEGRNFCAGMDLSAFAAAGIPSADTASERDAFGRLVRDLQNTISILEQIRFPVIAAIQGACVGAGLDLVAACDLRYATQDAYFRIEEINVGMMADVGSLQRLPKIMPAAVVSEMALTGSTLRADRAAAIGFVNAIGADVEETCAMARTAAKTIAEKPPVAITGSKAAMLYARDHPVDDALKWAAMKQSSIWSPSDVRSAIEARSGGQTARYEMQLPKRRFGE